MERVTCSIQDAIEPSLTHYLPHTLHSAISIPMPDAGFIKINRTLEPRTVAIKTSAEYIAVRSESLDTVPFIPWTVLEVNKSELNIVSEGEIAVGPDEFNIAYLKPGTRVIWEPVDPVKLNHIVLMTDPTYFVELSQKKEEVKDKLPHLLRSGSYIADMNCYVAACEPVDQGLTGDPELTISVVESRITNPDSVNSRMNAIDVEPFLEISHPNLNPSIELSVTALTRPIPVNDILPPVPQSVDTESIAFAHLSQLANLGIFSGDVVLAKGKDSSRYLLLHSHPDSSSINYDSLYVSPMLKYNLGGADTIKLEKVTGKRPSFEAAKDVTLSRVSSPQSTDKYNQTAFLQGLKSYFTKGMSRFVVNNDLIPIPINSELSKLFFSNVKQNSTEDSDESIDLESLVLNDTTEVDTVIWFQVLGLPDDNQHVISPMHTRMVQSGVVQTLAPSTNLKWEPYFGLTSEFDFLNTKQTDFKYAETLKNLLSASLTPRGASLKPTIMLKSSKRGAGKSTVLSSVAGQLGIHEMSLDAHDVIGDSDTKTLALLKARLERASTTDHCLVCIKHLEALAKKNDVDGKDTSLVNGLVDLLDEFSARGGLIIAATVNDPDVIADSVRMKFKFEVDVSVPTESERRAIFEYLTGPHGGFNHIGYLSSKIDTEVCDGFILRGDVSIDALALQSAGLTAIDLKSIIGNAKQLSARRATRDSILCSEGKIQITPDDLSASISDARGKFSDSIGAPKIPNVGWKDVGGLDMVKGEILDTIEMPLKHPELFASGLKKRSGILFYGPPGTGKTLLAKAIATNFSLNFFSVKGPELLNMYIGESEANVRRIFQKARDAKPCVVFFDELDSVAPKRGNKGDSGGVMDRIVSQLLAELDGMNAGGDGVFVVGATNRPDLLDEALLRPGRFDKMLYLGISDTHEKQRTILEALTRKFELDDDVNLAEVAEKCPFTYTGADFYALSSDSMLNAMTRTAGEIDAKISRYNEEHSESPITIRKWFQSIATDKDTQVKVRMTDFDKAMNDLIPSVSADELNHYLNVRKAFEGDGDKK